MDNLAMSFIEQLLEILVNPNISFLLLTIGVQAILIELSSPGGWVAGFIGAVSLTLAAYGLGVLSVNWFGVIFIVIAFALFILDIKAPTHGALTAAGVGSFIVGALVLFNSPGATVPAGYRAAGDYNRDHHRGQFCGDRGLRSAGAENADPDGAGNADRSAGNGPW